MVIEAASVICYILHMNIKYRFTCSILILCLGGCANKPWPKPPVVDKGAPLTSLTLADIKLGRHGSQANRAATAAKHVRVNFGNAQAFAAAPAPVLAINAPVKQPEIVAAVAPANQSQPRLSQQPPGRLQTQMRIQKLTEGYIQGNLDDAYELAKLLALEGRDEEAEVALDYASRQGHRPSMSLLAQRLKATGRQAEAQKWLDRATGKPGQG